MNAQHFRNLVNWKNGDRKRDNFKFKNANQLVAFYEQQRKESRMFTVAYTKQSFVHRFISLFKQPEFVTRTDKPANMKSIQPSAKHKNNIATRY